MTKKHFEEVARNFRAVKPLAGTREWAGWRQGVEAFVLSALSFNPRFDEQRFLVAAGAVIEGEDF